MVPPDSMFGVIPTWVGVYVISAVAFGVAGYILYRRVIRLVLLGQPRNLFGHPLRRLWGAMVVVVGQRRVLQRLSLRDKAGIGHASIFWGFLSFVFSYMLLIYADSAWHPFSEWLLTDAGVKVLTYYLNVMAAVILFSLGWALVRRWLVRPHRLSFDLTRSPDSIIIVGLTASLMVFTLLAEAFFVARGGTGPHASGPIGHAIGRLFIDAGMGFNVANTFQGLFWWLHVANILGFALYIPFSKHMHMAASPPNAFFRTLAPMGTLHPIENIEEAESFGANRVHQFSWKSLLDGYACAVCGRCTDNCPAHISGKVLSPMHVAEDLKAHLLKVGPDIADGKVKPEESEPVIGNAIPLQMVWDCVTCGACETECPVMVEHIDMIVDMRRYQVMEESQMPETAMNVLMNMEQRGHPWRGTQFTRTDWMKDMDVKTMAENPEADVLLWVGCTPALEERSQKIARAMASVLKRAGVDFAVLGDEEGCTGDPARRIGNEYLFQIMAQQNIETLNRYNVKKILAMCPHCFNTIKNEYPQLGGSYEVMHYSQFVDELIQQGRIRPLKSVNIAMTYHDSCYLGRHNGIYDEPRRVASAIPGLKVEEMERRRQRAFCCGAGGGHMWVEEEGGRRINHIRTEQFLDTGADVVGVSCPFCLQMFEEGIGAKELAGKKQAKDLIELVDESLAE